MPELPEVETIRLGLTNKIIGLKVKEIEILNPKSFSGDTKLILNRRIKNIFRKAKVLGLEIGEFTLLFHLKMSGQIIFEGKGKFIGGHPTHDMLGTLPNKSTRVIFTFNDNSKLYFNDQRKFGWVKVVNAKELNENKFINSLGPEPLEKEFTVEALKSNLSKRKSQKIKVALLDQTVVSGLGNIYVCEALFNSGINPLLKVSELSEDQYENLHKGIIKALWDGVKYGGSTRTHFVNADGKKGLFLDHANTYARSGEPCKICKTPIEKIKLGGRGTYFCPVCQK